MEWATATSLLRGGKQAYDNRHLIQKFWTRLKAYLDRGDTQIVITGHAGAGKTLLAAQMHGRARELEFELPAESRLAEVEAFETGAWAKLVRVLPGQDGFRSKGVREAFGTSKSLEGVIHVVDWGFVSPRDKVSIRALIEDDGITTVEALRKSNMDAELLELRTLLSDIKRSRDRGGVPKWLVIAVNKVDLFAKDRMSALKYYHPDGNSPFSKALKSFRAGIGEDNFSIYVTQVAAYEIDFVWNEEKVSSSLDRQEQNNLLVDFTKSIAQISENHS